MCQVAHPTRAGERSNSRRRPVDGAPPPAYAGGVQPCPSCSRHLIHEAAACPFCGLPLRAGLAPQALVGVVALGALLHGCGPKAGDTTDGNGSTGAAGSTGAPTSSTASSSTSSSGDSDDATASAPTTAGTTAAPDTDATTGDTGDTTFDTTGTTGGTTFDTTTSSTTDDAPETFLPPYAGALPDDGALVE